MKMIVKMASSKTAPPSEIKMIVFKFNPPSSGSSVTSSTGSIGELSSIGGVFVT